MESAELVAGDAGDCFEAAAAGGGWLSGLTLSVRTTGVGWVCPAPQPPARSVAEFFDPGANRDNVGPFVSLQVVVRSSPPNGIESGKNQHGMRMTLVSGAREPPECLLIGPRPPDFR